MTGYGGPVLLDMSAWARVLLGRVPDEERRRFGDAVRAGEVWSSEPFLLEALSSARDGSDHARLTEDLQALPAAHADRAVFGRALEAQAELARTPEVSHRVKPIDLLVAAIAHDTSAGVLHYDHDYDTIARYSRLRVRSVWIAPRGSMS